VDGSLPCQVEHVPTTPGPEEPQEATASTGATPASSPALAPRADGLIPQPHGGALAPPFKAGAPSANPSGRPSTKPIRDALLAFYDPATEDGAKRLRELSDALHRHATGNGRTLAAHAADYVRDTLDGPLERPVVGAMRPDGTRGPVVQVVMELIDVPPPRGAGSSAPELPEGASS
jgi:hypothetical protein